MDEDRARRLLGLAVGADASGVERAFRALARRHHPDRGGDPDHFRELLRARATLRGGTEGVRVTPGKTGRRPGPVVVVPDVSVWDEVRAALRSRVRRATPTGRRVK